MRQKIVNIGILLLISIGISTQKKITLNAIWTDYTFYTKAVPGFNFRNDGHHYTRLEENAINEYELITGELTNVILKGNDLKGMANFIGNISSYEFNNDETMLLIKSETESLYRRSSIARFHVYDLNRKTVSNINEKGKIMYATFSPDSKMVAFVHENNMFCKELKSGNITQITFDGKKNNVINGAADWVYEEEFGLSKVFFWSPDSKNIAFLRFNEEKVKEFTMMKYNDDLYPEQESFKYPKVGEENAIVTVKVYNILNGKTIEVDLDNSTDYYIPRIKWTPDDHMLSITKLNRHQNHLEIFLTDVMKNEVTLMLEEKNKSYIDIDDNLTFVKDKSKFIWTSEKNGFNNIYFSKGKEIPINLTLGKHDVTAFYGIDTNYEWLYYQAAKNGPLHKQIYRVSLKSGEDQLLSLATGINSAQFSSTFDYVVINHSTINSPPSYKIYDSSKKLVREIETNQEISILQKDYQVQDVEFFDFTTSDNTLLNGYMIKPENIEEGKQYPVLMYQYGGPGSQMVTESWKGDRYWWFQLLAQNGYIVACVDGRGTGARGEAFKKITYMQLGHYETLDQIEAAKYLGSLDYIDEERIGIFGWSYGGFMSTNCLLKGNDVFKAAIAVAPVTSWKWYDSVYTERYMRTLAENEEGYINNSPVYYAHRLKGNYLLVHGLADDNVHFQHTAEMTKALIKANKQFDTYLYPNRNHGIYGDNARIHLYTKMTEFIYNKI